jgi:glucose-1-phosphate adenylyltransferase
MRTAIAIVFAGGRVEELSVLTERRPKSAVVFGGVYRTIDFALTNLAKAGVGNVGILTQFRPSSLMDHVGNGFAWDFVGTSRGVRFLPPYLGAEGASEWYRGPADALYQNIDFIERSGADDVLAVSADHVYAMDYTHLLHFHQEKGADLTMAFASREDASRFGVGELNAAGQVMNFTEKPEYPRTNLCSMSVYVFRREVLVEELRRSVQGHEGSPTFQIHEVLRRMMTRRRAYGFVHQGGWEYTRTLDEYVTFHRQLLGPRPKVNLSDWQVRSNLMARRVCPPAPTRFLPGSQVDDSMISAGCTIEGAVKGSVLSPGVKVSKGAVVTDCVLWEDVLVGEGAQLTGVVSDKRTSFGKGAQVGVGAAAPSQEMPGSLTCGATIIGMDVRVPAGAKIGKNCILHPECGEADVGTEVASGKSVKVACRKEVAR